MRFLECDADAEVLLPLLLEREDVAAAAAPTSDSRCTVIVSGDEVMEISRRGDAVEVENTYLRGSAVEVEITYSAAASSESSISMAVGCARSISAC